MAELIQYANGVPGIKWPVDKAILKIGRSDQLNDIALDDAYASKSHAQIEIVFNEETQVLEFYLRDLDSTNHTYHNQSPIDHVRLSHNDSLMVGKSKFVFLVDGVREYITPDQLSSYSIKEDKLEPEDTLSNAVEEITREFSPLQEQADDDLDRTVIASTSGRHRFSRRLNIY